MPQLMAASASGPKKVMLAENAMVKNRAVSRAEPISVDINGARAPCALTKAIEYRNVGQLRQQECGARGHRNAQRYGGIGIAVPLQHDLAADQRTDDPGDKTCKHHPACGVGTIDPVHDVGDQEGQRIRKGTPRSGARPGSGTEPECSRPQQLRPWQECREDVRVSFFEPVFTR